MLCPKCSKPNFAVERQMIAFEVFSVDDEGKVIDWTEPFHEMYSEEQFIYAHCGNCDVIYDYDWKNNRIDFSKPLKSKPKFIQQEVEFECQKKQLKLNFLQD